jgi:hypothetical protein
VVTLRPGSYTAAQVLARIPVRPQWTVVQARPGTVTVTDNFVLVGRRHVVLAGIHFLAGVTNGILSKDAVTDPMTHQPLPEHGPVRDVVYWYDDIEDRYAGQTVAGDPPSHGVDVNPESSVWVVGCRVHNTYGDSLRDDGGTLHIVGSRQWGAHLVGPDHVDGLQVTSGRVTVSSTVFGLPVNARPMAYPQFDEAVSGADELYPDPSATGHVGQSNLIITGVFGVVTAALDLVWIANVAARFPLEIRPDPHAAAATVGRVRIWASDPRDPAFVHPGARIGPTRVVTGLPGPREVAPDGSWRLAHPYSSLLGFLATVR